ncbi:hypothetical protein N7495_004685 [Penicillium taxi]|uniref:uncharacterized protein n=1 Tax=Penicillium taxi TaxID=168475 RepID=UPI0025457F06|nr:uncharacterized protein N7495_004685 [Penicillium taxi]KAJ5899941.1 hypothetical protein N7495_004685 [Penicillium taxi]
MKPHRSFFRQDTAQAAQDTQEQDWIMGLEDRCPRADTVRKLANLVDREHAVIIRGTPVSGKSTLAQLLRDYYVAKDIPAIYIPRWPQGTRQPASYIAQIALWGKAAGIEVTYQTLETGNMVIILDEAQRPEIDGGPRLAIFSGYGSPNAGPEPAVMSPLGYFGPQQRVSITRSSLSSSPLIAFFYDRDEFDDVVTRYCSREDCFLALDVKASDYLFYLTNGQPGAVRSILEMLEKVYRSQLLRGMEIINEGDIRKTFDDENKAWRFLEETVVQRSFPSMLEMPPDAASTLRRVLAEGNIPRDLNDKGIKLCYEQGWLHSEALDRPGSDIVCVGASLRPVEACYQVEFYRCLHDVLGSSMAIISEWSPGVEGTGRIDFLLGSVGWGFELLRDGDRLGKHCQRFLLNGEYHDWIKRNLITDWVIIDCRGTQPMPYKVPGTKLIRAVFDAEFSSIKILGPNNDNLTDTFALTN